MSKVFILLKHPPYLYNASLHEGAGEIVGVYADRSEPDRIAAEKNARRSRYLYRVHVKRIKPAEEPRS